MNIIHTVTNSMDRLNVLAVLLKVKSPSLAAVELGVTQSAVSKTLGVLRKEFDDLLLVRRGDSMIPTAFGESISKRLAGPLSELKKISKMSGGHKGPQQLRIAMRDQFVATLGPSLAKVFCGNGELGRCVDFQFYDRASIADALERGESDLAVSVDPPNTPHLMIRKLYSDSFVCLRMGNKKLTLDEYTAGYHVVTTAHTGYTGIDFHLKNKGLTRKIVAKVPYFLAALELAKKQELLLTLPRRLAQTVDLSGMSVQSLPLEVPGFQVQLIWDTRFNSDPDNKWMREMVVKAAVSSD